MSTETMRVLFDYLIWATRHLWFCVESFTDEQFTQDEDYSIGSVYNQTFHLMQTDWSSAFYLLHGAWPTAEDSAEMKKEDYVSRTAMRHKWDEVDGMMHQALASLTDEKLQKTMKLPAGEDRMFEATLWELLYSMVNHGTNHRAQTLALIKKLGGQTTEQGAYFYYMQR
jgi:uncharacterized damage-inducible protein DinB